MSAQTSSPVITATTPGSACAAAASMRRMFGVGVRRADHMGMQGAARLRQIVAIAAAPRQQGRIFLADQRQTELRHQSPVEDFLPA